MSHWINTFMHTHPIISFVLILHITTFVMSWSCWNNAAYVDNSNTNEFE